MDANNLCRLKSRRKSRSFGFNFNRWLLNFRFTAAHAPTAHYQVRSRSIDTIHASESFFLSSIHNARFRFRSLFDLIKMYVELETRKRGRQRTALTSNYIREYTQSHHHK